MSELCEQSLTFAELIQHYTTPQNFENTIIAKTIYDLKSFCKEEKEFLNKLYQPLKMEISDLIEKYRHIGKEFGCVDEFTDNNFHQVMLEIGNIRLIYSVSRDGEEDIEAFYGESDNRSVPYEIRKELIRDIAAYLSNH